MENKKVYALYHKYEINTYPRYGNEDPITTILLQIKSDKIWQTAINQNLPKDTIVRFNESVYLSFSRAALVKKAQELKAKWIEQQKAVLSQIEKIIIK